ncbi:MAG: hypothetical protein ACE5JB_15085, partial [bacterium]
MKRILLFAAIIWVYACQVSFAQYPGDFSFTEVPDPLSGTNTTYPLNEMGVPAIGDSFVDLHFGTILTRTTVINGYRGRHEYSRFDPFNKEQSMIILDPEELWNIYRTQSLPYNQPGNLVRAVHLEEPRWDPNDPNLIWGLDGFSIKSVDVSTGQTTMIKDFSQDAIMGPIITQENVY